MIVGIGIDITELKRIEQIIEKQPRFVSRVLTKAEKEIWDTLTASRKVEFLAGRFSAKEAYSKANGTGIGKDVSFLDIEILPNEKGKPVLHKKGEQYIYHVSISHSDHYVVAQVIIEMKE